MAEDAREAFTAIEYDKAMIPHAIIRIDSSGRQRIIMPMDTSLHVSKVSGWFPIACMINDSCFLYESKADSSINVFNNSSHIRMKILEGYYISLLTKDGRYFCTRPIGHRNVARDQKMYRIKKNSIELTGETIYPGFIEPFGRDKFLMIKSNEEFVINPDFTVIDSSTEEHPFSFISDAKPGFLTSEVLYQHDQFYFTNIVWVYNSKSLRRHMLFDSMNITGVVALPVKDLYLLRGQTDSEYVAAGGKIREKNKVDPQGPKGYWMLASSRTQQFYKLGFEDYQPTVSSSGRHILFYKQTTEGYDVKILPVPSLP